MSEPTTNATPPTPTMAPARIVDPSEMGSPARKGRGRIRRFLITLLLAAYAAGCWYFSSHFVPGTEVDSVDASLMTVDELTTALSERASSYVQHLTDPQGFDLSIAGTDISLSFESQQVAEEARTRVSALLWPLNLLTPQRMLVDGHITVDEKALAETIGDAVENYNDDATPPTNSEIALDEENGTFVVTLDAVGAQLDADKVLQASLVACRELRAEVVCGENELLQPEVTHTDERLVTAAERANAVMAKDFSITFQDEPVATITPQMKASLMYLDDDLNLSVDAEQVLAWVEESEELHEVASWTDDVHVWELDPAGTADVAYQAIRDGEDSCELALNLIETKPDVTPGAKERGRHIDVNLTSQFVRFYDESGKVIWDSYCVSGGWDYEKGIMHSTPTGNYAIERKDTGKTLIGADLDGDNQPDYESYVNYWMPFLNNDYGFHDATWRSKFGGDIRTYWGSHGCINLPFEKAKELFGIIKIGDKVYIHD